MSKSLVSIIQTADGSHTLYHTALDETFHSRKGAVTESRHVFIKEGMDYLQMAASLDILEVGFGTGLNAILTLENAVLTKRNVSFTTLEPYPLELKLIEALNYNSFLEAWLHNHFFSIYHCPWSKEVAIVPEFDLRKLSLKLEEYMEEPEMFDLIFFDAFAPRKQPDMWVEEHFVKLYRLLRKGGVLVSYCASGHFKRCLLTAGFRVKKIPGPPGKKEMIRAYKD
jgi:tRNA U34 5-methylaminomethyl-2-thiouridine-forming methyltransferase MnmC